MVQATTSPRPQRESSTKVDLLASFPVWAVVVVIVVASVAGWLGYNRIVDAPSAVQFKGSSRTNLRLWASLVGVFAGYGVVMFVATIAWTRQLYEQLVPRLSLSALVARIGLVLLVFGALWLVGHDLPAGTRNGHSFRPFSHQIFVITLLGAIASIPGLLGMLLIRTSAVDDGQWCTETESYISEIASLRSIARRILGALGVFLAILVVLTAARRQSLLSLHEGVTYSSQSVILYSFIFVVLLAAFYTPAITAINGRCEMFLSVVVPPPTLDDPDISGKLQRRQDLGTWLGMNESPWDSFQQGLIIFAPLLGALFGVVLPGRSA